MFVVTRERLFPQPLGTTERSFSMCATCPPLLFYLREFFHLLTRGHYALQCSAMLCNADYFRFQGQRLDPRLDSHRVAPANKINLSRCGSEVVTLPLNVYLW
jgi:hypothetical protein